MRNWSEKSLLECCQGEAIGAILSACLPPFPRVVTKQQPSACIGFRGAAEKREMGQKEGKGFQQTWAADGSEHAQDNWTSEHHCVLLPWMSGLVQLLDWATWILAFSGSKSCQRCDMAVSHPGLHWLLGAVLVSNLHAGAHQQEKGPFHLQSLRAQSCFVSFLCLLLEQQLQLQLLLSPTASFVSSISQNSSCISLHCKSNDYAGTFPEKLTSLWCGTALKKAPLGPREISTR